MPDLAVDTRELCAAAAELRGVATATEALGGRSGRAMAAVPAFGAAAPAQAVDSFLSSWVYGVGWIGVQAHELAVLLAVAAHRFDTVDVGLALSIVDGTALPAPPADLPPPVPEPVRRTSGSEWGRSDPVSAPMRVQLSGAKNVAELIPGDPELVRDLANLLNGFADDMGETRSPLATLALGGWQGLTAYAVESELTTLVDRLVKAELAFAAAGAAVSSFARTLAEAHSDAAAALALWREAEYASQVWRGAVPGASPAPGVVDDPGAAGMARAVLMLESARRAVYAAGRLLVAALVDAEVGSPNDPGWMATLTRHIASFGAGNVEWMVGAAEGAKNLAGLAIDTFPLRFFYDREGYDATSERLANALKYAGTHPGEIGNSALNLDTLKSDPARWAGRIGPDLVLLLATAGMAYAARSAAAVSRIERVEQIIAQAGGRAAFSPQVNRSDIDRRLGGMGFRPDTPSRAAASQQLNAGREPDAWVDARLPEGQLLVIDPETGVGALVEGVPNMSAREWAELFQVDPIRTRVAGDPLPQPRVRDTVYIYEVEDGALDVAKAIARSNPEFGRGGGTMIYVHDIEGVIDAGRLGDLGEHKLYGSNRAHYEDPLYRHVDADLPVRALNPTREGWAAGAERGQQEVGRAVGSAAAAGVYERVQTSEPLDDIPAAKVGEGQNG